MQLCWCNAKLKLQEVQTVEEVHDAHCVGQVLHELF